MFEVSALKILTADVYLTNEFWEQKKLLFVQYDVK